MKRAWLCVTLVAAVAGPALAGPRDYVVSHAGEGGTSEQAAPFLEKFLGYAETTLGWPPKSTSGKYFPEPDAELTKYLAEQKPGFGMLDVEQFLELRKKHSLTVLATAHGKGKGLGHLHLLVKDPALKTLDHLKGKALASNHLQSVRFLSKLAFEGKIDVAKHFGKLEPKLSVLKAIKAVENGEAQAALVSDEDEAWRKTSAYAGLTVLWSSPELPPMVVVAFGKIASPKDREAFAKMLPPMCGDPKGAAVCKDLGIDSFTSPDKAKIDAAIKRFEK